MAGPLPQQLIRQAPLASRETFACLSVDKKRLLSPFVRARAPDHFLLLFNTSKRAYDQKGRSSPKLQTLTREVWSSPAAFLGEREALNLLLCYKQRTQSNSRGRDTLAREDRAPLASKQKSPLPHPRQEETESFLQSNETEKSSISIKKQTGPSKISRKKRAPFTPQSARRDLFLSR